MVLYLLLLEGGGRVFVQEIIEGGKRNPNRVLLLLL